MLAPELPDVTPQCIQLLWSPVVVIWEVSVRVGCLFGEKNGDFEPQNRVGTGSGRPVFFRKSVLARFARPRVTGCDPTVHPVALVTGSSDLGSFGASRLPFWHSDAINYYQYN